MKKHWLVVMLVMLSVSLAWSQTTDPTADYQLQISCSGVGCSPGIGTGSIVGEVNGLSGNTVNILENGNGSPAVLDPVLLIIGVPNPPSGYTPPQITKINGVSVTPFGPGLAGGAWGWNGSSAGTTFNSLNGSSAYAAIGLKNSKTGAASESFANWQTTNSQIGLSTSSYTLFVYALPNTKLSGGKTASVTFGGNLPIGTFIIAYSCSTGVITAKCTTMGDNMGATPFTVSGEFVHAPEPTTLAMLGVTGILGLAGGIRRKRRL